MVSFPLVAIFCNLTHGDAFDGGVETCILGKFDCHIAVVVIDAVERHMLA